MIMLDYRDARPIYEQVRDGLRKLMVSGILAEGEKLPSVRALAGQLAINPNTIQRAYEALEREGYVYSIAVFTESVSSNPTSPFIPAKAVNSMVSSRGNVISFDVASSVAASLVSSEPVV